MSDRIDDADLAEMHAVADAAEARGATSVSCGTHVLQGLLAELRSLRAREASAGWVSTAERMPIPTDPVWFFANDRVMKGEIDHADTWITSAGFAWLSGEITHWMPRPREPKRPAPPKAVLPAVTEGAL